jgi:3-isopropylmalate/(R)-2-methylmalate dehydratase small subunit
MQNNTLTNLTQNVTWQLRPLGDVVNIVQAGGIFEYARKNDLMASTEA